MNILEYYYYNLGQDATEQEREITQNTFNHLLDNGFEEKYLMKNIAIFPVKNYLEPCDLPEELWNDSLLKKDIFYFHNLLHILSPAPYWDVEKDIVVKHKYYLEMKIQFNINDIVKYFYKNFSIDDNFKDESKDSGAMNYLYKKYEKMIDYVEPVDFILFLIDEAKESGERVESILDLSKYELRTNEYLKRKVLNAKAEKINKITWR